jgi:hypothetical protein
MRDLLQTVIPALLTAVVAGRIAITRTGRLRSTIRANVELLGTLPADHPSRATLKVHIEELVGTLVRREAGQFEPITPTAALIGVNAVVAAIGLLGTTFIVIDPLPRSARMAGVSGLAVLTVCFAGSTFWAWRQRQREDSEQPEPEFDGLVGAEPDQA